MGWTNEQASEITAPSNVPFQPGFDVMGIGSQVPPELMAAGVSTAMVFYNSSWDPTSTTPLVKFMFMGTETHNNGGAGGQTGKISIGFGLCQNPSINQTATISRGLQLFSNLSSGVQVVSMEFQNSQGNNIWAVVEDNAHNPTELGITNAGGQSWHLPGTTLPGPN